MQELRIILIIVGLLFIAAILFHGLWTSKKEGRAKFGDKPLGKLELEEDEAVAVASDDYEIIRKPAVKVAEQKQNPFDSAPVMSDPLFDAEPESAPHDLKNDLKNDTKQQEKSATVVDAELAEPFAEAEMPSFSARDELDEVLEETTVARENAQSARDASSTTQASSVQPSSTQPSSAESALEQESNVSKESTVQSASTQEQVTLESRLAEQTAGTHVSGENTAFEPLAEQHDVSLIEEPTVAPQEEPEAEPEMQVIVLNVHCIGEEPFEGEALFESMRDNGLVYGEMEIYHRHVDLSGNGSVLFSVANMMQPGTLVTDDPSTYSTKGICFFMTLPGYGNEEHNFNVMLQTAQQIANDLGGHVLDERRNILTHERITAYRRQIVEFNALKA